MPYFKSSTTIKTLQTKLMPLIPFLESYCNLILDKGIKIPFASQFSSFIKNQTISTHDGFLLIDADANFDYLIKQIDDEIVNETKASDNSSINSEQLFI